jgi:acetyltransferase-like isoleucine patch superfamily enzyme
VRNAAIMQRVRKMASLNQFLAIRNHLIAAKRFYLNRIWGMDIHPTVGFSLSVRFDKTNPRGIHIGANSYLAFDSAVLSHDALYNRHVDTWIGATCFIGARSIILPGVRIGDGCVIGAGSVVASDIPAHCVAIGNPARVVKTGIVLSKEHVLVDVGARLETKSGNGGQRTIQADPAPETVESHSAV